jgi:hypothetical protein
MCVMCVSVCVWGGGGGIKFVPGHFGRSTVLFHAEDSDSAAAMCSWMDNAPKREKPNNSTYIMYLGVEG